MQSQICEEYYITTRKQCRYKSKVLRNDGKRVCLIHLNSYTHFNNQETKSQEVNLDPPSDPVETPIDPPIISRVSGPRTDSSGIGQNASRQMGVRPVHSRIVRLSASVKWDLTNFTYPPYMKNFDFTNRTFYSLEELEKRLKKIDSLGRLDSYLKHFSEFNREI